jgi:hypothetical protein
MEFTLSTEEVNSLLNALNPLIELKLLFRKSTPKYQLNDKMCEEFLTSLKNLKDLLNPVFSKYLAKKYLKQETESIEEKIKKITSLSETRDQVLVSSNSAKKILKALGIDPRDIIVSGGPLFFEDFKLINPNIPDKVLPSIKKKCERILEELKSIDWKNKELYFIYEKEDIGDSLILDKMNRVEDLINKEVKTIALSSWDDLS